MDIQRVTIDDIEIDAVLTEKPVETVDVTKHPIERGVKPSDHAELQPTKLAIDGVLSNTSVNAAAQMRRGGESRPGASGAGNTLANALRDLLAERRAVSISTSRAFYDDMIMTSLELPRDAKTGDAVRFTATFERIVIVQSTAVLVPKTANPKKPSGKKDQGKKQPSSVEPGSAEEAGILKSFLNGVGVTQKGSGKLR